MKADKLILGVLGGVAIGALVGVLFAPDKGSKTRKVITDKSTDYADDLKSQLDVVLAGMQKKYDKIWQEGENLIAQGKSKFSDAKNEGDDLLAQGKSRYYDAKNEGENLIAQGKSKFEEVKKEI